MIIKRDFIFNIDGYDLYFKQQENNGNECQWANDKYSGIYCLYYYDNSCRNFNLFANYRIIKSLPDLSIGILKQIIIFDNYQ